MKTSVYSLPDERMSYFEAVDYAKKIGAAAIEPFASRDFAAPDVETAKRLAGYAGEKGVKISCFSMMADVVTGDVQAETERLKKYADVAAAMGSPLLHHTLIPYLDFSVCSLPFKEVLRRTVRAVREVYDYAEQKGVKCAYEDQGFYFNGVHRFDDFLGEAEREVGVVADFGNILFAGETPEAFVGRFAGRVVHVHAKDYLQKDGRWPNPGEGWYVSRDGGYLRGTIIGHGVVNFRRVLGILQSVGYDGYYSLEYDGVEDARLAHRLGFENLRRFYEMARLDGQEPEKVSLK